MPEDREPQPEDGPEYHADHAAWVLRNHVHNFVYHDDEYGSLGDGGSYEVYKCTICFKRKYYQLPD